jgi:hypothetical protein
MGRGDDLDRLCALLADRVGGAPSSVPVRGLATEPPLLRRRFGHRVRLPAAVDLQFAVRTGGVTLAAVRDGLALSLRIGFESFPDVVGQVGEGDEVRPAVRTRSVHTRRYVARGKTGSVVGERAAALTTRDLSMVNVFSAAIEGARSAILPFAAVVY